MTDVPPNGKGISTQEWVRDILAFLIKLIESNDKRYAERWTAQEQAITKQENAQAGYNLAHNGLLADNRKQSEDFSKKIELILAQMNSHFQLPIHPGGQAQIDALKESVRQLQEIQTKFAERQSERKEVKNETVAQTRWSTGIIISALFSSLAAIISVTMLILKLMGK